MELYRKELKLAVIKGLDESRGSSNVPIKLTHDTSDEYINYTEQIHIRYLFDNQVKEEILPTNDNGFYIPGKPLSHDGPIELAVHLINGDIELVTNELSFVVKNAPNGTTQVDPSEFTWQQLVDQYVNAKLDTFANKLDLSKFEETVNGSIENQNQNIESFKTDVNANLSNQDKKITDFQNTTKASLDSQNTKIDNFKSEVNTSLSNQNTSINQTTSAQNSKITTLESRMDTFTRLSEGSTTGDAELHDIRVGANGTTYDTAGNAVRGQYSQLKEDLINIYGDETISKYKLNWIENEYVNGNTGEIITYNGWKRTDYTEIKKDFPLYFTTNKTTDNEDCAYYDENKNYVGKLYITANSDMAINRVPTNAKYFIISCHNSITMKAYCDTITIKHLYEKANELENKTNPYMLPKYYDSYMVEKNNKVNNLMDSISNCVSFAFITDQHLYSNAKNSGYMIKNIIENTPIRDVINGGDVISAYGTEESIYDDCNKYHKYWGFLNPYFVRGNHDIYASPSDDMTNGVIKSNSMVINRFIRPYKHDDMVIEEGRTYYYFDRPQNKVRFICLDTTEVIEKENTNIKFSITQAQIDWFVNLLKNTPNGYKIIVCNHIPINNNLLWYVDFCLIFGDIIEAFNGKTTINTQSFNVSVNTDFSNTNGKVILSVAGHGHVDSYHISDTGCVYYEANCDSMINNGGSPYERVDGTVSEQSFDVFIINADNGDIHTIKYGAGIDRTLILH